MEFDDVCAELERLSENEFRETQDQFGINTTRSIGVSVTELRKLSRNINPDHDIALALWETEIHEARILASMADDETKVSEQQMEDWATEFDSWDLCDQVCNNLFRKTSYAIEKAEEWVARDEEYIKRAGFSLIATLAIHSDQLTNSDFTRLLLLITENVNDERHYVKKGASWAIREIGKRNHNLSIEAIATAEKLKKSDSTSEQWIARDVLKDLT